MEAGQSRYKHEYYLKNKDRWRDIYSKSEKRKKWLEDNREKVLEYNKSWKEKNKDKVRNYRKKYRETHKEEAYRQTLSWKLHNMDKVKDTAKKYQQSERYKIAKRKRSKQYRDDPSNKAKIRARQLCWKALKSGELSKPTECQSCGASGMIYAHHDNYDKPLDVCWLCPTCHNRLHHSKNYIMRGEY